MTPSSSSLLRSWRGCPPQYRGLGRGRGRGRGRSDGAMRTHVDRIPGLQNPLQADPLVLSPSSSLHVSSPSGSRLPQVIERGYESASLPSNGYPPVLHACSREHRHGRGQGRGQGRGRGHGHGRGFGLAYASSPCEVSGRCSPIHPKGRNLSSPSRCTPSTRSSRTLTWLSHPVPDELNDELFGSRPPSPLSSGAQPHVFVLPRSPSSSTLYGRSSPSPSSRSSTPRPSPCPSPSPSPSSPVFSPLSQSHRSTMMNTEEVLCEAPSAVELSPPIFQPILFASPRSMCASPNSRESCVDDSYVLRNSRFPCSLLEESLSITCEVQVANMLKSFSLCLGVEQNSSSSTRCSWNRFRTALHGKSSSLRSLELKPCPNVFLEEPISSFLASVEETVWRSCIDGDSFSCLISPCLQLTLDPTSVTFMSGHAVFQALLRPLKTSIILDLDHTLVHAQSNICYSHDSVVLLEEDTHLFSIVQEDMKTDEWIKVKIRPGARELLSYLSSVRDHVNVIVCSAGTRAYVDAVVRILDPFSHIIHHIVSREGLPRAFVTRSASSASPDGGQLWNLTVSDLAPANSSCIKDLYQLGVSIHPYSSLILDDRPDVWVQPENVIRIEPYCFFDVFDDFISCSRVRNMAMAGDLSFSGIGSVSSLEQFLALISRFVSWRIASGSEGQGFFLSSPAKKCEHESLLSWVLNTDSLHENVSSSFLHPPRNLIENYLRMTTYQGVSKPACAIGEENQSFGYSSVGSSIGFVAGLGMSLGCELWESVSSDTWASSVVFSSDPSNSPKQETSSMDDVIFRELNGVWSCVMHECQPVA